MILDDAMWLQNLKLILKTSSPVDEPNNEILGFDETVTEFLYFDEPNDSANTSDGEENLQRDICLILQEHSGNVSKKWGNLGQWVLELQDGRRVAVLI